MNLFALTPVGKLETAATKLIDLAFPGILDKLSYEVISYIPHQVSDIADGAYEDGKIYLHKDSEMKTVIHEFGHAVHYQLLTCAVIQLPEENKSERAYVNFREDFAEAFADAVLNFNQGNDPTSRDIKVRSVLS